LVWQAYDFSNFPVKAGNVIQIDITATSTIKGTVKLTNVSSGKSVSQTLNAPHCAARMLNGSSRTLNRAEASLL
jgi:hypothetical protein